MSGPIVRKYGFPNHEQIFGRRPPEHGVEDPKAKDQAEPPEAKDAKGEAATPPKPDRRAD